MSGSVSVCDGDSRADWERVWTYDLCLVDEELLELLVLCALADDVLADVDLPAESVRVPAGDPRYVSQRNADRFDRASSSSKGRGD